MKIRIAGFEPESVVDGPGIRFVIFTQGCIHNCEGCHNPQTHDPQKGEEYDIETIKNEIQLAKGVTGITFSGGEPFLQAEALSELVKYTKQLGLNVVVYSGYLYQELLEMGEKEAYIINALDNTDILIDGRFDITQKDLSLAFRGSHNQRVIDLKQTRAKGEIVFYK